MHPTIFGVMGPGFLNQVPTLQPLSPSVESGLPPPSGGPETDASGERPLHSKIPKPQTRNESQTDLRKN